MDVFIDGSLVELYINVRSICFVCKTELTTLQDRFWLTTRIYPGRTDSTSFGIFVGNNASVEVSKITAWTGTANIFPERPLNSSSELVFDTAEQTNNYTWWTGL